MKKRISKLTALFVGVAMVAGMLAGCGGKEEKGSLNLFTWDGMFPQEVLDGFEQETGYTINFSHFDYDEDMLAKLEEAKGGDYDLVIADDYIIEVVIAQGLSQKLDTSKLKNYSNLNPVFMSQFYDPQNEYTVPYGAGIPLIVYDPTLTDVEITGYEDLWNEQRADSIAVLENARVLGGMVLKTMGKSINETDPDMVLGKGFDKSKQKDFFLFAKNNKVGMTMDTLDKKAASIIRNAGAKGYKKEL